MQQANDILYQVKGLNAYIICALNQISARPPESFGVHNINEGIMNEYVPDYSMQIQHDVYDHGQDDYIKYIPPKH